MNGSYLVIPPQARHIEFGTSQVAPWKKFMMLSLMKPRDLIVKLKILMKWEEINWQIVGISNVTAIKPKSLSHAMTLPMLVLIKLSLATTS